MGTQARPLRGGAGAHIRGRSALIANREIRMAKRLWRKSLNGEE